MSQPQQETVRDQRPMSSWDFSPSERGQLRELLTMRESIKAAADQWEHRKWLRDGLKGWAAWVIAIITALTLGRVGLKETLTWVIGS